MEIIMEIIGQLFSEILIILLALGLFVLSVGIKVSCPHCGARFYYKKNRKTCPACQADLLSEIEPEDVDDGLSETVDEPQSYLCYNCGREMEIKFDYCPDCGCWLGDD